jgi:acylphosphatase
MSSEGRIIRHVIVRGFVQGIGYRAWTESTALARRLEGWVRNRRDGTVEAVFAGPAGVVEEMIAACRRGPSFARVDAVDVAEASARDLAQRRAGESFSMLPTV